MRADSSGTSTVVHAGAGELVVMWLGFPLLGAGAVGALAAGADWLTGRSWVPFQDVLKLVAGAPEPYVTIGAPLLGALAGLVVALIGTAERLTVTVERERIRLRRDRTRSEVSRRDAQAVFRDGNDLMVLGAAGQELVRESGELPGDRLAAALREHGWPWTEQDPYRNAYRRWVPELPGLPAGADALLRARQRALERGDGDDLRDLHTELGRLGVVVRDERKRQYWRPTDR
ncbi:YqeB family protein [Micromonospora sp. WMMA1923]|uniref:YqeB family protein n=1 Tax=Micromonospora sp. WMMA1923 TaxID=3404125 RepID=UPI003B948727